MCQLGSGNETAIRAADVVVISDLSNEADIHEVIKARDLAGRPTIVDLEPPDVSTHAWSQDEVPQLAAAPGRLATSVDGVTTVSTAVYATLRAMGLRAHLLPPLLTREHASELRGARGGSDRHSDPLVGWHLGSAGAPVADYVDAVTDAVLEQLAERPNLVAEIVGERAGVPPHLLAHPRVSPLPPLPGAAALSHWTVHLWSPALLGTGIVDTTTPFVEASAVGVPTVLPQPAQAAIGGSPSQGLSVVQPHLADSWTVPLRSLLDDQEAWSTQSQEAVRRFDAMYGPAASEVAVNRFLGWALAKGVQP